ncbi:MAG: hypothetical protein LBD77_08885 [Bifidobacteriaceae bacterium]|jgi:hypothetical protein|nr:hypothetical protein [Bifidobacteriaceae bacterium]
MESESLRPSLGLGDLLMGRYRLDAELFSNLPNAQRFRATDKILSRDADVYLLTGRHTEDAVDAARRAALVEDPRIVRIIDAGSYSGVSFVLTAPLDGVSLADVGPLPAAQARAVAGEVASALAGAAARDVHHLALRPELVYLGQGETVRIGGMAWDAAQRGIGDTDAAVSSAIDAKALVSILYAALTARWPGETPSVMPPPPLWDLSPVAPIELVSGVPGDLNTLCAVALAVGGVAPSMAAEVVADLGLWPPVRINLPFSASVRGPIPRAVTPPSLLPAADEDGEDGEDAEDAPVTEPPDRTAADAARAVWPAGAEPLRPTDEDVAALATQAVIQDRLAAIEAIVVPPGEGVEFPEFGGFAELAGADDAPADPLVGPPADALADVPDDVLADVPDDALADVPDDALDDSLADPPVDALAAPPGDALADPPVDPLADPLDDDDFSGWGHPVRRDAPDAPDPDVPDLDGPDPAAPDLDGPDPDVPDPAAPDPDGADPTEPGGIGDSEAEPPAEAQAEPDYALGEIAAAGEAAEADAAEANPADPPDLTEGAADCDPDQDAPGADEPAPDEDDDLGWPIQRATPPPALSSLAEQLDPVELAAREQPVVKVGRAKDVEPTEFALPPLPDDLAEVLATVPPLHESERPYEPLAVGDLDDDATLVLDPIDEEPESSEDDPEAPPRPPNRTIVPAPPSPLSTPVAREDVPPGPDEEHVRAALRATTPRTGQSRVEANPSPPASPPAQNGDSRLFDIEPPTFDKVLGGQGGASPKVRNWWPIITFIAVAVACVCLGLVIMQQVGVLSLGVPLSPGLSPGLPPAPGGAT